MKQPDPPVTKEVLATAIENIGAAAKALRASGLNEKGIIALLHDGTKLPKRDIKAVLEGLRQLQAWYCR